MKRIAVIGTGIAGLTTAYYLAGKYDITVYEEREYIGGHTHTVDVDQHGELASVDTGFIVFNDRTYPRFIRLLNELGVAFQSTEMSFSVRNDSVSLEYNGNNINTLFAQRSNLVRPGFWRMVVDIMRFNRDVRQYADREDYMTIGEYLAGGGYGSLFAENYLLPMIAAIWSMGMENVMDFPLSLFIRFFENHGLLNIIDRPQWYTIKGGSRSYIAPLTARFADRIRLNTPVQSVERHLDRIVVRTGALEETYDEAVLACHGDQALALLQRPTIQEQQVLGAFSFTENQVTLHTDISVLPRRKQAWASWNYHKTGHDGQAPTLTYNMNILQQLNTKQTYLVSLNSEIAQEKVIERFTYTHPMYSQEVIEAQQQWGTISGTDRIHYCGAYWFNGFHEDGVRSGQRIGKYLGVES